VAHCSTSVHWELVAGGRGTTAVVSERVCCMVRLMQRSSLACPCLLHVPFATNSYTSRFACEQVLGRAVAPAADA
jgi:hypothetical protein